MLGATPPRRISRSSTRNETEILSSCSTTRESLNSPAKDIRWSVAMEPQISRDTPGTLRREALGVPIGSPYGRVMAATPPSSHLTHDELDSVSRQRADCAAVGRNLRLERVDRAATAGAPSLQYDDFRELVKRDIVVSDAAARLADALHLHLD